VQSELFNGGEGVELPLSRRGVPAGTVEIVMEGSCAQLRATMKDPGDGLYRAVLTGALGELPVGVMAPEGGGLVARRRVYRRDVQALGELRGAEARCFRRFGECWRLTKDGGGLLSEKELSCRLEQEGEVWYRREGEVLHIAIPWRDGAPFPLETLFCLARVERVQGERCVLYRFDEKRGPLLP